MKEIKQTTKDNQSMTKVAEIIVLTDSQKEKIEHFETEVKNMCKDLHVEIEVINNGNVNLAYISRNFRRSCVIDDEKLHDLEMTAESLMSAIDKLPNNEEEQRNEEEKYDEELDFVKDILQHIDDKGTPHILCAHAVGIKGTKIGEMFRISAKTLYDMCQAYVDKNS